MTEKNQQDEQKSIQRSTEAMELALEERESGFYVLRLYVSGMTPNSQRAIENVRKLCSEHLQGRHHLEIIDIYQQPTLAKEGQVIAAPTLVRELPPPLRKFIGDMSKIENLLIGLNISTKR